MSSNKIGAYFDATETRPTRDDLVFAASLFGPPAVAVDAGCGAGSDIAYLRLKGFDVHGFDIEQAAIDRCRARFRDDPQVLLYRDDFDSFHYPRCDLFVADASLFFCPVSSFDRVWHAIRNSLNPGGVFCGSFLGEGDTMASSSHDAESYWPVELSFDEIRARRLLEGLDVMRFNEARLLVVLEGGV